MNGNKKAIIISGLIVFVLAIFSIGVGIFGMHRAFFKNNFRQKCTSQMPLAAEQAKQFLLPQDAAKSGEVAIVVNDLEVAKQEITTIASKNGGVIFESRISYDSEQIKNGTFVLQAPVENFEQVVVDVKAIALKVVEESSRQVSQQTYTPAISEAIETRTTDIKSENLTNNANPDAVQDVAVPQTAIYPSVPVNQLQSKGYIRIVFVENGQKTSMISAINNNQSMPKIWIAITLKVALLIALIGLLIFLFKRIFNTLHAHRIYRSKKYIRPSEKKNVAHVVRQRPRSRIVRITKK